MTIRNTPVKPLPYRRRPVAVEAIQLTDDCDWEAIAEWCAGKVLFDPSGTPRSLQYRTGNPLMHPFHEPSNGEWVVRFPDGFTAMGDQEFQAEFESTTHLTCTCGAYLRRQLDDGSP